MEDDIWRVVRKPPSNSEPSPRAKVRERLAAAVEEINREIANSPFSVADCPPGEAGKFCMELFRVELRNDLGLDRHSRVHYSRVDLDADENARKAYATLVGAGDSSFGFFEEREQLCQGENLRLMKEHGLRMGIIHYTVGGIEITRGIIDLAACLDLEELSKPMGENRDD